MIRFCIFDLDGTLLNTLKSLENTTGLMLARFGYPPVDEAHIRQFVGDGYKKLVERVLVYRGDLELVHYEEALSIYSEEFERHCMDEVKPYPGIAELLRELKGRGIRTAVLSNKQNEQTVEIIETVFGKGYFDYVAGERPGIPKKPDPAGVLQILDEFGETAEHGLYLGDTNTDMKTGLGAGLTTVGVTWGFRDREELESFHPQHVIDGPGEILEFL